MLTRDFQHDYGPDTVIAVIGRDGIYPSRHVDSKHSSGERIDPVHLIAGAFVKARA